MPEQIHLCVCGDAPVRVGLHVVLGSCAQWLGADAHLHATVIDLGLAATEGDLLRRTLERSGRDFTLEIVPADPALLASLGQVRRFYGSRAPYFKLMLPAQLAGSPRVLFLDSDIVVCADVAPLFATHLKGHPVACVHEGPVSIALEGGYFQRRGFAPGSPFFNSGVLLIDPPQWQREDITRQCLALLEQDGAEMRSADQTALNVVLRDHYLPLPTHWNRLVFPNLPPVAPASASGIYHLVGRPKPWEPFGEAVNRQSRLFTHYLDRTALAGWRSWKHLDSAAFHRMGRLARSYWNALARRVKA